MISFFTTNLINIFDCFGSLTHKCSFSKTFLKTPWFIETIHKLIKIRNQVLSKYVRNTYNWLCYKKLCNLVSSAIRREKQSFLNSTLFKCSPRDFWKNLSSLAVYYSSSSPTIPDHLLNHNNLNNYFSQSLPPYSCSNSVINHFLCI